MKTNTLQKVLSGFSILLVLLCMNTNVFAQCTGPMVIFTATPPALNGTVDNVWANAPVNAITKVVNGTTQSDYSGQWRAMYDANYLYVLVEVKDATLKAPPFGPNPWDDDDVEIYIDANNTKTGQYGAGDYQFAFNWGTTTTQYGSSFGSNTFSIPTVTGGYNLVARIAWSSIGATNIVSGKLLGFDININDNDGGNADHTRQATNSWNSASSQNFNTPSLFGTATLSTCSATGTTSWSLTGNAGTTPGIHFLGTTDAKNLLFKVAGGQVAQFDTRNSVAFENSTTTNYFSTAMGSLSVANGWGSTAIGSQTIANGGQSTAMGNLSVATGFASFAVGSQTKAVGNQSVAMGNLTSATGFTSFAMGSQATTTSDLSTAIGNLVTASGYNSFATGNATTASGQSSYTTGEGTVAPSYTEVAVGSFNLLYTPVSTAAFNVSDRVFSIGNGTSSASRNNALTVFKNGTVAIGTVKPPAGFLLAVNGSAVFQRIQIQSVVNGPDYVFDSTYKLISIPDLEQYITVNKHLPGVPSAADMLKNGVEVGDNQSLLLKKIEELTLYTIDQDKKIKTQDQQLQDMQKEIDALKDLITQKIAH